MAGDQDELISKALLGMADVPAHEAAQSQRDEHVRFGARATRMPALAVVLEHVDVLVDAVLDLFPRPKVALQVAVAGVDLRFGSHTHVIHS